MNNIALAAADFKEARRNRLDSINLKSIETYSEPFFKKAIVKYENSEIDSALVYIDYAISIYPTDELYWFTRGEYYFEKKNFQESIESYNKAIATKHDYTEAWNKKGEAYYHLQDYKAAIDAYTTALKTDSKFYLAQKGIGESLFALKDYSNAIVNLENSIKAMEAIKRFTYPKVLAEAYNTAGKSYYSQKAFDKAMQSFKNALKKNSDYSEAYFNKGLTNYQLRKYDESISDILKAIDYETKNADWYYQLAKAYQVKKDFKNAVLNYTSCINNGKSHVIIDAVYNRGLCYYQAKQFDEALADYLKVQPAANDSLSKTFDRELATIYLHISKYDLAIAYFDKSLEKNSEDGYAMYGIACSMLAQENKEEALRWFEKSFRAKSFKYNDIKDDKFIAQIKRDKSFKALVKKYF
jgi:tetratricopeptide (TPR) repeat protein